MPEPAPFHGVRAVLEGALAGIRALLEPDAAETLATFDDGSPAITRHDCGHGQALYLAGFPDSSHPGALGTLLAAAGVERPTGIDPPSAPAFRWRWGFSGDRRMLFLFNPGTDAVSIRVFPALRAGLRIITGATESDEGAEVKGGSVGIVLLPAGNHPG
jgi:hypothetical protein